MFFSFDRIITEEVIVEVKSNNKKKAYQIALNRVHMGGGDIINTDIEIISNEMRKPVHLDNGQSSKNIPQTHTQTNEVQNE